MPRAMWSGMITFGMVTIPVKLFTATESKSISFHQLHDKCNTRIKEQRWCPHCEEIVDYEHVVKGYEYSKNKYIILTEEDMEKLPLPSKSVIDISAFVKLEEIDPVYFEKSYYLEPDPAAVKPFGLFIRALQEREMVGVATVALRNKERLCALRPFGDTLMMETLFYPDEIRVTREEKLKTRVSKQEMDMALSLIDLMAQGFEPEKYQDNYREALKEVIEAKLEGEEVAIPESAPAGEKVVDLMEALKASVERMQSGKKPGDTTIHKRRATTKKEPAGTSKKGAKSSASSRSHGRSSKPSAAKTRKAASSTKSRRAKSKRGAA